jgi:hypothetical protein
MAVRLLNQHTRANAFPILFDATTLGASESASMIFPWWRDLAVAEPDRTNVLWIVQPFTKRRKWRSLGSVTSTGPSDVTVLPTALDITEDSENGIAFLEIVAGEGDEVAFVRAVGQIDWLQRPAADFARAVRLALAAGAHLLARKLAAQGARLYPDHRELQKMSQILAPPRVLRTNLPANTSARANLAWMRAHAAEYREQWVALKDGALLASAPTARELKQQLPTTDGLFLTRVV